VVVVVIKGRENARKRERRRKKEAEKDLSPLLHLQVGMISQPAGQPVCPSPSWMEMEGHFVFHLPLQIRGRICRLPDEPACTAAACRLQQLITLL
jgi:hypothetical protein